MLQETSWKVLLPSPDKQKLLADKIGASPILAQLLLNRQIATSEEAEKFLFGQWENFTDPFTLPGMEQAVQRIAQAIDEKQQIMVYGDYDVDGITATAVVVEVLRAIGAVVDFFIPNRLEEGYGLNINSLQQIVADGVKLIITVDCGISAVEEAAYAEMHGVNMIITDHHEPGCQLPETLAVVNPKLAEGEAAQPLAGVGVAFKLVQALNRVMPSGFDLSRLLDLVALGTVADIVPLVGDNRLFVKKGLEVLKNTQRAGIKALFDVAGIKPESINCSRLAFALAPRINAAGRLGTAAHAVELLLTTSAQKAWELARRLDRENSQRQLLEKEILEQANKMIEEEINLENSAVLVLASRFWHAGVIGIVASRLVERYGKPVILIALEGDTGKGSGRSARGLDLFKGLQDSAQYFDAYGGHSQAVGLTIRESNIGKFREHFNSWAKANFPENETEAITLEAELFPDQIDIDLVRELELLEPFGCGNPAPVFAIRGGKAREVRVVGKNSNHLKITLKAGYKDIEAIAFNMADKEELLKNNRVDLAFSLERNTWQGNERLQLNIKEIRAASANMQFYPEHFLKTTKFEFRFNTCYPCAINDEKLFEALRQALQENRTPVVVCSSTAISYHYFKKIKKRFSNLYWLADFEKIKQFSNWHELKAGGIILTTFRLLSALPGNKVMNSLLLLVNPLTGEFLAEVKEFSSITASPMIWWNSSIKNRRQAEELGLELSHKRHVPEIIDARGNSPAEYIRQYDMAQKIIVVDSDQKAFRLTDIIQHQGYRGKVICCHRGLSVEQKELIKFMLYQGVLEVVVTSGELPWEHWMEVFLCRLPVTKEQMAGFMEAGRVHLLFNSQQLTTSKEILSGIYPVRKELGLIYRFIKSYFDKGISKVALKKIVQTLRHNGWRGANSFSIWLGLKIFSELDLLKVKLANGDLILEKISDQKINLQNSWRYLENEYKRHEENEYLLAMASLSEEQLLQFFVS